MRRFEGKFALAAAVALSMVAASLACTGSNPQAAEQKSKQPTLFVATSGSDSSCARGNPSRPCSTFDAAYAKAQCGDIVHVRAGSYPGQRIREVSRLSRCRTNVTFAAAPGASVTIDGDISLGDNNAGSGPARPDTNAPDRLTIRGLTYSGSIVMWGDATFITVENVAGGSVLIQGAQDVTIRNSEFGPCPSYPEVCTRFFILDGFGEGEPTRTSRILVENNTIHDYTITRASDHWECIFASGGHDVTIRGNRIYNCDTYGLVMGENGATGGYARWVVENNWFGDTCCFGGMRSTGGQSRPSAVNLYSLSDALIRFNSFAPGQTVTNEGCNFTGCGVSNVRIVGNILGAPGCANGARYSGNLFLEGRCASDDRGSVYGYSFDGKRLRVVPREALAIRSAFEAVRSGKTPRATARALAREGLPRPWGGWTGKTVVRLLRDDVYLGRRLGRRSDHARLVAPRVWLSVQKALPPLPGS